MDVFSKVPPAVRPAVEAARRAVRAIGTKAEEMGYRGGPPRSRTYMWKLVRYTVDGANVLGIGTFPTHSTIFFYRGRELDDASGLLKGSGKDSRFVTLREPAEADSPAVKGLIRQAFKLGGVVK